MDLIKKLWEAYKPFRKAIITGVIIVMALNLIQVVVPYISGTIINSVSEKPDYSMFVLAVVGIAALEVFSLSLSYVKEGNEVKKLDFDLARSVRGRTSKFLLGLSMGQHHNEHSGVKQSVINKGESSINELWQVFSYQIFPMICQILFSVCALFIANETIGTINLLSLLLAIYLSRQLNKRHLGSIRKHSKLSNKVGKYLSEIMDNVGLIKVNSKESFAISEQDSKLIEVGDKGKAVWLPFVREWYINNVLPRMTWVAILFIAGKMCFDGKIDIGQLYIVLSLSRMSVNLMSAVGYMQRSFLKHKVHIERYMAMTNIKPDIVLAERPIVLPHYRHEIELRNICFTYGERKASFIKDDDDDEEDANGDTDKPPEQVLIDVSCRFVPNKIHALVGASGSGKSTLKHLMLRAYDPQIGSIAIGGIDLKQLDLRHYHSKIGTVDQDVPLFDRTLRDNLTWVLDEGQTVSDEKIWQVCRLACVDRFANRLEKGLDMLIGERGVKLSGGERQRVAIARALMKDPDILICDEATSSLDAINEDDIIESIARVSAGKTTIVIAHRFSTILSADIIHVMDKGRYVGQGTHDELMETCKAYRNLVERQVSKYRKFVRRS